MDESGLEQVLAFFKALAEENRLRIVGILAEREHSVKELATLLELKPAAVSRHVRRLEELGLVRMRAEGTTHRYQLDTGRLETLRREVLRPGRVASPADALAGGADERKVLRDFLDGERLKVIPANQSKRLVVLRFLAGQFAPGVRYAEREVNALLQRHHPDSSTLRRLLVDHRLLQRTPEGVYWRTDETPSPGR